MPIDFHNRKAVVTGGANGIGLACARELAAGGAEVWILDLAAEQPVQVASSLGMHGHVADVTSRESLEQAFAACGTPDVVIANAGMVTIAPLEQTSRADWDRTIAVNLTGMFETVQIAARLMKPTRSGSIVLTASTNSYDGEPNLIAYNASKAGVLGLLHTAAGELGPHGIRVNAVCPGLIRTRLTEASFSDPSILKDYFRHIALGRGGEPVEVARAAAFLASGMASYITGAALFVDGGQMSSKFGTWNEDIASFHQGAWKLK